MKISPSTPPRVPREIVSKPPDPKPSSTPNPSKLVRSPFGPEPFRGKNPPRASSGTSPIADTRTQDPLDDLRKQLADAAETAAQKAKAVEDAVNQGLGGDEVKKRTEEWKKAQQKVIDLTEKLIAEMTAQQAEAPKGTAPPPDKPGPDKPGTRTPGTDGANPGNGTGGTKVGEKPVGARPPKIEDILARIFQQALEKRIPGYDQLQNIRKLGDLFKKFMSGDITSEQLQNEIKAMGLTLKSLPGTLAELKKQAESGKPLNEQEVFDKLRKAFLEDLQNPELKGVSKEALDALQKALDAEGKKIAQGGKASGPVQGGGAKSDKPASLPTETAQQVGCYWATLLDGGGITADEIRAQLGDLTREDLQTMRAAISRMTGVSPSTIKQLTDMIDAYLK